MGKRARPVPPLVLEAVAAAYRETRGAPGRWTSVSSLNLDAEQEKIDAAILLAALSGWVSIGGKPAHSVIVTAEGIEMLKKKDRL
jgi:hypothetical protein